MSVSGCGCGCVCACVCTNLVTVFALTFMGLNRQLQHFFNNPEISAATKLRVFQTMVMPVLLYCMHLVPLRKSDQRWLDSWLHTRVRWILSIRWEEKITNQEVWQRATAMLGQFLCPPSTKLCQLRLRAFGPFARHDGITHSAMVYIRTRRRQMVCTAYHLYIRQTIVTPIPHSECCYTASAPPPPLPLSLPSPPPPSPPSAQRELWHPTYLQWSLLSD